MAPWVSAFVAIGVVSQAAPVSDTFEKLKAGVTSSEVFQQKVAAVCAKTKTENCHDKAVDSLFCQLLKRSKPDMAAAHCGVPSSTTTTTQAVQQNGTVANQDGSPKLTGALAQMKTRIMKSKEFQAESERMAVVLGCNGVKKTNDCDSYVQEAAFCLAFADQMNKFGSMTGVQEETKYCEHIDDKIPKLSLFLQSHNKKPTHSLKFMQVNTHSVRAPEDDLAQEMTHDLEMNFNKIAPFGKEDTAKELQDHAAKTQDTLVDAVENAEVAEIKRAVFRALTRLRAATIKEFDTIARLETQAIDAYNDAHHYRAENPLTHLHEDEAPVETDKLKSFH
jgi:hypothetical protein